MRTPSCALRKRTGVEPLLHGLADRRACEGVDSGLEQIEFIGGRPRRDFVEGFDSLELDVVGERVPTIDEVEQLGVGPFPSGVRSDRRGLSASRVHGWLRPWCGCDGATLPYRRGRSRRRR